MIVCKLQWRVLHPESRVQQPLSVEDLDSRALYIDRDGEMRMSANYFSSRSGVVRRFMAGASQMTISLSPCEFVSAPI
jgi:hypothetical protein